jgi:hypothetical protein
MKYTVQLFAARQAHDAMIALWKVAKPYLEQGQRLHVTVQSETRSLAQNSRLWSMLGEVARQVDWYGRKLDAESWKHIFSSALKKQNVVPSLDGKGFVVLGISTSKMTVAEMSELQTLIEAFGAERGVIFNEPETTA